MGIGICMLDSMGMYAPPSCGEGTRSSPQGRVRILLCPNRLRRLCLWCSMLGLLARRGSSGMGLGYRVSTEPGFGV